MAKTILVPLDGSALSESALPYATSIARSAGSRLVLTRVAMAYERPGVDLAEDQVQAVEEAERYLLEFADRLAVQGIAAEIAVPYGAAAEMILAESRIRGADLIVMATHGRTGLGRALFGSVADLVLRGARVPVLLVPQSCKQFPNGDHKLRIMVTLDGSGFSEAALGPADDLADALGADLVLLEAAKEELPRPGSDTALTAPLHIGHAEGEHTVEQAEGHLERIAVGLRAPGRSVEAVALAGTPARLIADEAENRAIDLIAIATHGRGGLARVVMGSVTTEVLKRAGLPLLVVRPTAVAEATEVREVVAAK